MFWLVKSFFLCFLKFQVAKGWFLLKAQLYLVRFLRWDLISDGYAVLGCCIIRTLNFRILQHRRKHNIIYKGTRVVGHKGRDYRQGNGRCQFHQRITICAIGERGVIFTEYFKSYWKFISLNFHILILCFRCVAFMILNLFYASLKKCCYVGFMLVSSF